MPLYEYHCNTCGEEIEDLTRIGVPGPSCCGQAMRRLVSLVAIRPSGIRVETEPVATKSGGSPKKSDRDTIDGVAQRIVRESRKPGNTPVTHDKARETAVKVRSRKVRDGRG